MLWTYLTKPTKKMTLLKSGRFGHSKTYVQSTYSRYEFRVELCNEAILRTQGGKNVAGAVVVLQKMK
jgi:predicted TPR repeat methyltransferase